MFATDSVSLGPQIGDIAFAGANPKAGKPNLDAGDFMKLLTVQLTNQDPMNPMQDTEFIAQMANFTSLEQTRTMAEAFQRFTAEQTIASSASYLGQQVTVKDPVGETVQGVVEAVTIREGKPQLIINGQAYEPRFLTSIGTLPPGFTPPPPDGGSEPAEPANPNDGSGDGDPLTPNPEG